MKHDASIEFGNHLQRLRRERKLSIRELARKAAIDSGGLTRLEQGKTSPRPATLKALAVVLEVPVADLFAHAGYLTPADLPNLNTYLRVCYGELPEDALTSLDAHIRHLIDDQGLDGSGPVAFEDETTNPSQG
jgi:transcriptional regulator with XRE-family HTH domain